jgi:hypothetical protein
MHADTIYEALLFLLAKQQVPIDADVMWGDSHLIQFTQETVRIVFIHNIQSGHKSVLVYPENDTQPYYSMCLNTSHLLTPDTADNKIWDILTRLFGIKPYPFKLLIEHGIPNQSNISEQELKEARLR